MNYLNFEIRNILRHRKRSIVTILTICLGFTALGVIGGMVNNIYSRLKGQAIVSEKLGHITFAKQGFFQNGKIEPEDYLWDGDELKDILKIIKNDPNVELATPRISLFGIASNNNASTIFLTEAIVPEDDHKLLQTEVDGSLRKDGTITLSDDKSKIAEVAIGQELSDNLGIKKGDYFTLLTTTKTGMANAVDVDVTEVYNTGNPATNDKFVLTNFDLIQSLYDTEGAQRIVVTVKDDSKVEAVKSSLTAQLQGAGYATDSRSWNEMSLFYEKVKTTFAAIFRVLTIIITVVVLLTLLNTMQMSVTERTKEIGTMRAIGVLKRDVIKLFCIEGITMGIIGCLLALPVLLIISNILQALNVTFVPPVASAEVPIILMLKLPKMLVVFFLFLISSLLSSFWASNKISKQPVVDSLLQFN